MHRLFSRLSLASFLALAAACGSHDDASSALDLAGTCATPPAVGRSLFVAASTDPDASTVLAPFSFKEVFKQILSTGNAGSETPLALYQQTMDTLNDDAHGVTGGPHCNGAINGFAVDCPRQEGILASSTTPFTAGDADSFDVLGLVNRFDLAPQNGANCGQYRIVFGKHSGRGQLTNRLLVIVETVLPNPNPSAGIAACLPVAQFWDNLTSDDDATDRGRQLHDFYYKGLPGFSPAVSAQNLGIGGGANTGQIRMNLFMVNQPAHQNWQLREFRVSQACVANSSTCSVTVNDVTVKDNPFVGLFSGTDDLSSKFQNELAQKQVASLAASTLTGIGMSTPDKFNAGESTEASGPETDLNDYEAAGIGNASLVQAIQASLTSIGSDLTPKNILDRATTQSCAGCHQISPGRDLGDGLVWPASLGFVQIREDGALSNALTGVFLPARANVLVDFLNAHCGDGGTPPVNDGLTLGGSPVGSPN